MDSTTFNILISIFMFVLIPTFLMVIITSRKINSAIGYLGMFLILAVDPFSPLGLNILPSWFMVIGILLVGVFFWQFMHNRRSS
jgi:hypothetical protein